MNELIRSLGHHAKVHSIKHPTDCMTDINTELYCELKHCKGHQLTLTKAI